METETSVQNFTIESILDSHDKVYVDSTILNPKTPMCTSTFNAQSFAYLDVDFLERNLNLLKPGIEILRHPSTYTVSDVTGELSKLLDHIGGQLSHFGERPNRLAMVSGKIKRPNRKLKQKLKRDEKFSVDSKAEELYREIHGDLFDVIKLTKRYQINNNSLEYLSLFDIIMDIKDSIELNDLKSYELDIRSLIERDRNDTDVVLTTHVLYDCFFNNRNGVLLSGSSKYINMIAKSKRYLGGQTCLHDALSKKGPILFFIGNDGNGGEDYIERRDFPWDMSIGTKTELSDPEGFYKKVRKFAGLYKESENRK